ncbi:MAG: B12-binding domain-containing radical SAM protein [Proteobacteria bacterium]|nr:B12-binding domain-containing radical SAM protein [Pseudomonadota bacterium]
MKANGKQKVVLIIPNSTWFGKRKWLCLPYAALILTAILKQKYKFSILDANGNNLTLEELGQQLSTLNPAVILITAGSVEYHKQAHAAAEVARKVCPTAITVIGGIYPTVMAEEVATDKNIDWVFMNHAEERFDKFLELVLSGEVAAARAFPGIAYRDDQGKIVELPVDKHVGEVANMVRPDYSLVDMHAYIEQNTLDYQFNSTKPSAFIITSYGCPHNCLFCASRTISGRRTIYRPVEHVLDEIRFLVDKFGVGNLIFLDDAFLNKRKRLLELLEGMNALGADLSWKAASVAAWQLDDELLDIMKASGCEQITISVESGSQRVLTDVIHKPLKLEIIPGIVKKCREVGISCGANFVIGLPGETWEDLRQTFAFADSCDFDVTHFHIATPLPKTDLYYVCKEKGYLPPDFSFLDPNFFGYAYGFITTEHFTPLELAILRAYEWDRINFATPERAARAAKMYGAIPERLEEHRRSTRRRLGLHVEGMDEALLAKARWKMLNDAAK